MISLPMSWPILETSIHLGFIDMNSKTSLFLHVVCPLIDLWQVVSVPT